MSRIELAGLSKSYGARRIIDELTLDIEEGEFFVLLGPSGCGKTTTLRCLAGLEAPDSGVISIGARQVAGADIFVPAHRRGIGMVFQNYALWPHLSIAENVAYPLRRQGARRQAREAAVERALGVVGLTEYRHHYPPALSGGQQQRVALARALAADPSVILFDEPLSNLDARLRIRLRDDLKAIHRSNGCTALYVTHDQSEAVVLGDRVAVMNGGRIEQIGTPEEVFRRPVTGFAARFVGFENVVDSLVEAVDGARILVRPSGWNEPIEATGSGRFHAGQPVLLAFRASAVRLIEEEAPAGSPAATIVERAYLGDHLQVMLRVGDGQVAAVTAPGGIAPPPGTRLHFALQPADARVLPLSS